VTPDVELATDEASLTRANAGEAEDRPLVDAPLRTAKELSVACPRVRRTLGSVRPARAPLYAAHGTCVPLPAVASAQLVPRGPGYDPRQRLRRRAVALRGGTDPLVVVLGWANGSVRVRVHAAGAWTGDDVERAIVCARGIAAVDDDPTEFLASVRRHPVLGPLVRGADPRLPKTPTVFEALAIAIIEQLVTGFEARASIRRLFRATGEAIAGTSLVAAPSARAVHRVPMWRLRELGIGSRRAATLHRAAARGDAIERLRAEPPEIFLERIQSLPGVGPWTANAVARAALGWSDAVPMGDFHAPYIISASLGREVSRDDPSGADRAMLEVLEPFRPHRARAALLLERAGTPRMRLPRIDPHRREPWKY
jgi:3-methyladenine DNA glycosylase/8-oxoguanine DNA glycosylase